MSVGGLASFVGVRFVGNAAAAGSGGAVFSGRALESSNLTATGNTAGLHGGALFLNGTALMTEGAAHSLLEGNNALGIGGAIFASSLSDPVALSGLTVRNNSAYVAGGGAYSRSNDTVVANSTFVEKCDFQCFCLIFCTPRLCLPLPCC